MPRGPSSAGAPIGLTRMSLGVRRPRATAAAEDDRLGSDRGVEREVGLDRPARVVADPLEVVQRPLDRLQLMLSTTLCRQPGRLALHPDPEVEQLEHIPMRPHLPQT